MKKAAAKEASGPVSLGNLTTLDLSRHLRIRPGRAGGGGIYAALPVAALKKSILCLPAKDFFYSLLGGLCRGTAGAL